MMLEVDDLKAGYDGREVLKGVSFQMKQGEMVGIIGPNGAGKSTLLKAVMGQIPIFSGKVSVMGGLVQELSPKEFAKRAAYLQQSAETTFSYTAREVVMAGRYPYLSWWQQESEADRRLADACLAYTGVEGLAERPLPAMSGGQRQRVLLAKVLAQQTPLLLLDEPSTGLDLVYQEEIFRFCQELCRAGKTVLMVVHELSLAARFCSRLLLIAGGRKLADGIPSDVLSPQNLSQAYGRDFRVVCNPLTGHLDIFTEKSDRQPKRNAVLEEILGKERTAP